MEGLTATELYDFEHTQYRFNNYSQEYLIKQYKEQTKVFAKVGARRRLLRILNLPFHECRFRLLKHEFLEEGMQNGD